MISCGFINAVLFVLLIFSLKEAFFVKAVKKWEIFEYTKKNKQKNKNLEKMSKQGKSFELRFKSQSTNNLFFGTLFKFTTPKQPSQQKFEVSANIVKIKLKKSQSCMIQNTLPPRNIKNVNSTSFLLQKENERKKMQIVHIQKNNYVSKNMLGLKQPPDSNQEQNKKQIQDLREKSSPMFEPIHYFMPERQEENFQSKVALKESNTAQNYDEWQNIMSFKSLEDPCRTLNDGFLEKMGEDFKSFDACEEKFLDVILNFKPSSTNRLNMGS